MFRSDNTGYRVGKSLMSATGINRIRDILEKINGMWNTQTTPPPPTFPYRALGLEGMFFQKNAFSLAFC